MLCRLTPRVEKLCRAAEDTIFFPKLQERATQVFFKFLKKNKKKRHMTFSFLAI